MRHIRSLFFLVAFSVVAGSVFAGLSVSPGTPVHTHTDANTGGGTLAVSGTVSSTKACAAGFSRKGPNYCINDDVGGEGWVDAVGCTARTFIDAVPVDAKLVHLAVTFQVLSGNAVAYRSNTVNFRRDSACSIQGNNIPFGAREFSAVAAGNILSLSTFEVIVSLTGTNTVHTTQLNAGGNGNADILDVAVLGYFD